MRSPAIALIDCNSFYCSCERLFRPDLAQTPIVVLSNNDGCAVSLTPDAKALGFKMGAPYFQMRDALSNAGVAVFSSNYALYGDISSRVMTTIESIVPNTEIYSIDECFADLTGMPEPMLDIGRTIRATVLQWTGIPVGVGIAPTKTLAKLANRAAKKWHRQTGGVVDLRVRERQVRLLQQVEVDDIWGIGSRLKLRLNHAGIHTGWDLAQHPADAVRRIGGVVLERTARELNGTPCLELTEATGPQQMICRGRSFGTRVHAIEELDQAVAAHGVRAAEKLRSQNSVCNVVRVSIRTSFFTPNSPTYANSTTVSLAVPTDDTRILLKAASEGLRAIYREGFAYAKAEVMLMDLQQQGTITGDLFTPAPTGRKLMNVMDAVNRRMGRDFLRPAAVPSAPRWAMARTMMSPAYSTQIDQIWRVSTRAGTSQLRKS